MQDLKRAEDTVLRAITNDNAFRVIVADTTQTVKQAVEAQSAVGRTAAHFAELLTGTVLVRETMAPTLRVQGIVKGAEGRGSLVGDSHPNGATRGLVQLPPDHEAFDLGPGSLMQMMRSLPNGAIQQGIVDTPAQGGLSTALMAYLQESEQVVSVVAVGVQTADGRIVRSGGYIVQLLPEVERAAGMIMSQRLEDFPTIDRLLDSPEFSPRTLLAELLHGMPYTELEESEVRFECQCTEASLLGAIATLPRKDIVDLAHSQEGLDITCDYCGTQYNLAPERLRTLLQES